MTPPGLVYAVYYWVSCAVSRGAGSLLGWPTTADGVAVVCPKIALLFKAKGSRFKDQRDFDRALPHLDRTARAWLASVLEQAHPGHAWRGRL
jgi:hypothetical protein